MQIESRGFIVSGIESPINRISVENNEATVVFDGRGVNTPVIVMTREEWAAFVEAVNAVGARLNGATVVTTSPAPRLKDTDGDIWHLQSDGRYGWNGDVMSRADVERCHGPVIELRD